MSCLKFFGRVGAAMMLIFSTLGCAGEAAVNKVPASFPYIQYFGRWDVRGDVYRSGQGATYIKVVFEGTEIKADITGADIWWAVSVDGEEFRRLGPVKKNAKPLVLASKLSPGLHRLTLVRSTEGQAGVAEFRGFILDKGARLQEPEPVKKRRLEFVGDSITAGAINLAPYNGKNYHATEDGNMAYGPQLARLLDADFSVVAKSGGGLVHNYAESWPPTGTHAVDLYGWTFYYEDFRPDNLVWDAKKFPVDGVIIAIGTNDFTDPNRQPTQEEFQRGYAELIKRVRQMNPTAKIICTEPLPVWLPSEVRGWIRETVEAAKANGEGEVYFIPLNEPTPLLEPGDYIEGDTHPSVKGDAKMAAYLKDKVAAIMEWET